MGFDENKGKNMTLLQVRNPGYISLYISFPQSQIICLEWFRFTSTSLPNVFPLLPAQQLGERADGFPFFLFLQM